jgi:hypothetical protein
MAQNLEWYQNKIQEMLLNDESAYSIFAEVDKMFHGDIALPQELQDLDDVRLVKDSSPHDSLYNATVALANSRIRLEMNPLGDQDDEFVRANQIEQALLWNWNRANMRGPKSRKMWGIAHSALRYDLCVTRVDDLMFYLPKDKNKWSKANKRAARAGRFVITVLPPHKVHFQVSEIGGTFCVVSARNMSLPKVIDYYESIAGTDKVGKQIKAAIAKIKAEFENSHDMEQARFMLYQYTDDDKRLDYGHITDGTAEEDTAGGADDFVFIDAENKIPFINYTIRGGASEVEPDPAYDYHPMLASAHWNDSWKNSVLTRSLVFSEVIRRIREVRETYEGAAADMVPADDGTGGAKAMPPGTSLKRQPPTNVDPQALALMEGIGQDLNATTSASALGNLSRYSNTAFSTMNAIVQVEMGKLNPQKNIIQDTIADQCFLFCEWAKFTKEPLQAWRTESKKVKEKELPKGEEIQIKPDDYDLDRLFLSCTITPATPTDQMQQMNITEKLVQLGMSAEEGLEMMNVAHAGLQKDKRNEEILKDGVLQALLQKITALQVGLAQLDIEQKKMELMQKQQQQQQAQQQPPPGGGPGGPPPEGGPFAGMEGAGADPAAGGMPPIQGAPGMGREQINGMARNGMDVAA